MAATARMSRRWLGRMAIVGAAFVGFAIWCVYDGMVRYPAFNRMVSAYNRVVMAGEKEKWEEMALQKGWPVHFEGEEVHADGTVRLKTAWDIRTQYIMAVICALIACPVIVRILWARNRTMLADDQGFVAIDGTRIPYAAIRGVDKSKWQRKSIAVVRYELNGVPRSTRIDDWIFEGGEAVLQEIEARLDTGAAPVARENPGMAADTPAPGGGHSEQREDDA